MILNIVSLFALPRFCLFHEFPIKFYSHVDSVLWISHRQRHVQNYRRRGDECCRLNSHDGRDAATSTPGRTDKGWIPTPNRIRPTLFSKMRSEVRKLVKFQFFASRKNSMRKLSPKKLSPELSRRKTIEMFFSRLWNICTVLTFPSKIFSGHVNGVNVIGLSLQQQGVPPIPAPGLKPPSINQTSVDFSSLQVHLQPRRPTTGNCDFLLPLQPELLLGK